MDGTEGRQVVLRITYAPAVLGSSSWIEKGTLVGTDLAFFDVFM